MIAITLAALLLFPVVQGYARPINRAVHAPFVHAGTDCHHPLYSQQWVDGSDLGPQSKMQTRIIRHDQDRTVPTNAFYAQAKKVSAVKFCSPAYTKNASGATVKVYPRLAIYNSKTGKVVRTYLMRPVKNHPNIWRTKLIRYSAGGPNELTWVQAWGMYKKHR